MIMLQTEAILFFAFAYICLLFAIAYYGDKRADMGTSIISNPYIYALSLAVYCTAWTFYGSVGRAATSGPNFLTIYIGPTLMFAAGWFVLRKIIRISKTYRITSIADFIASRYGKSPMLGGLVSIIAVIGIIPYISIQLKAVSKSFLLLVDQRSSAMHMPILSDTTFYVALILAVFSIFFGTRHLDVTERHEGLVAAIAFESVVKLAAFLAVGTYVTYGLYLGFGDLIENAKAIHTFDRLMTMGSKPGTFTNWGIQIFISMMAILFLPRQFQMAVVENVNEEHLNKAIWLFPLYLFAINIFVLPIALCGLLQFPENTVDPDTFVLSLPIATNRYVLTMFVFIGGISAATGMVIVETIALSTMICNELVMPILLRIPALKFTQRADLSNVLLAIRRGSIIIVLLLSYFYFRFTGEFFTLVSIGLISFVAVTQFAPAILGGIFWKGATRAGAVCGLVCGFVIWLYTLILPHFVQAGILPSGFETEGPFGIAFLKPYQLFGLTVFDEIAHSVFWSMLFNIGAYVGVSALTRPSAIEHTQAALFVDVFQYAGDKEETPVWRGTASLPDLRLLLTRFIGEAKTEEALTSYAERSRINWRKDIIADASLVSYIEKLLAGAIGSASARVIIATAVKEEPIGIDEVMDILDETRQAIAYSHELEKTSAELKAANIRLKELDRLKDDFIATVTHELKTPLTSVRSVTEILHDNPAIDTKQRQDFLSIIVKESERLTRLITQVLSFQKMETGRAFLELSETDLIEIINDSVAASNQILHEKQMQLHLNLPDSAPKINADRDRLIQVMMNLISNAVKFCEPEKGEITIQLTKENNRLRVDVIDNGVGIRKEDQEIIFEKFRQIKNKSVGRPPGSGLGLSIVKHIIESHNGWVWVTSEPGKGATFSFTLPI
jgi:Na+/proline symporter/nitrogen-specific signal transduction histidine kinase